MTDKVNLFEVQLGTVPDEVREMFKNEEYEKCGAACGEILSSNPNNGIALLYTGKIAGFNEDYAAALTAYRQVAALAPDFYLIWQYLGETHLSLHEYKEAADCFFEWYKFTPFRAEPLCYSAISYFMLGQESLALKLLSSEELLERVQDKSKVALARGILEDTLGNKEAALMSFLESQMLADEDNKNAAAGEIYRMLTGKDK
jgi:tetratricopeptide (TPR) repeat protein